MAKIKQGNLIDALLLNNEVDFIFHCCNCQNNFGSGIAKEIRERIPEAYVADTTLHKEMGGNILGIFSYEADVFNLYGQEYYGYYGDHFKNTGRQINYGAYASALTKALDFIRSECNFHPSGVRLGFPYEIGSDRAGGDWEIIKEITEFLVGSYGFDMVWYRLGE